MLTNIVAFSYSNSELRNLRSLTEWSKKHLSSMERAHFRNIINRFFCGDWFRYKLLIAKINSSEGTLILHLDEAHILHELIGFLLIKTNQGLNSLPSAWLKPVMQDLNLYRLQQNQNTSMKAIKKCL